MKFEDTGLRDTPLLRRAFAVGYAPIERELDGRTGYAAEEVDKGHERVAVDFALTADASSHPDHEAFAAAALAGHDAIADMADDAQIMELSPRAVEIVVNTADHRDKLAELIDALEKVDGKSLRDRAKTSLLVREKTRDFNADEKFMMRASIASILGTFSAAEDREISQYAGFDLDTLDALEVLYEDLSDAPDEGLDARFKTVAAAAREKVVEAGLVPLSFEDTGLPDSDIARKAFEISYEQEIAKIDNRMMKADIVMSMNKAFREGPLMIAQVVREYAPEDKKDLYTAAALMIDTATGSDDARHAELGVECADLLRRLGRMDDVERAMSGEIPADDLERRMDDDQKFFLRTALLGMVMHINTAPFDDLVAEADMAEDMLKELPAVFNAVAAKPQTGLEKQFGETLGELTVRLRAASDAARYSERSGEVELYSGGPAITPKFGTGRRYF